MKERSTTIRSFLVCLIAVLLTASSQAQDGWAVANYAFYHTWDHYQEFGADKSDCAAFASRAEFVGGWQYISGNRAADTSWFDGTYLFGKFSGSYTWGGAANFERFLRVSGRATFVKTVTPTQTIWANNVWMEPGDLIVADWGDGDESEPPSRNKADGTGHHIMVVQQSLGNGDFVYCQHGGVNDAKMRRFFDVLYSPNLSKAQYRFYHVNGNDVLQGLSENHMYRDNNRARSNAKRTLIPIQSGH